MRPAVREERSSEQGAALVIVLVLLVLTLILSLAYLQIVTLVSDLQNSRFVEMKMEYKSEEAVAKAVAEIRYNRNNDLRKDELFWDGGLTDPF